jgi:hypothetical protein
LVRAYRVQIVTHRLGLFFNRHVGYVVHAVECAVRIRLESREQRVEVFRRGPGGGDKLECLAQRLI